MENISKLVDKYKLVVLLIVVIPALLPLFHSGFFTTHDAVHVPRVYEMDRSLSDGQFPVRWIPDIRYGEPTFNFYAPLPYYIGAGIHHLGFDYIGSIKVLIGIGFIACALAMFLLVSELYGYLAGLVSALFYTYAPYHSVDSYVRGALPESWALIFFPLILWSILKLSISQSKKNVIFLALSIAGLLLTHNIMSLIFAPFAAAWAVFFLFNSKSKKYLMYLVTGSVLGLGLSASFWLPAFMEKNLVQNQYLTKGYFDFRGHFVAIFQFFKPVWGYEASVFGAVDNLSFQIGLVHWLAIFLSTLVLVWQLIKKKQTFKKLQNLVLVFSLVSLLFSLFIQHNQSIFIWDLFSVLSFVQFPWRFLGISIFFASLIAGYFVYSLSRSQILISLALVLIVIAVNINYFQPQKYVSQTDQDYIAPNLLAERDRTPKDYLPIWVKNATAATQNFPEIESGQGEIKNYQKRSASASFDADIKNQSSVSVPIYFFPNWEVFDGNQLISQNKPLDDGLIYFNLPPGSHHIRLVFSDTPVRNIANLASVFSVLIILSLVFMKKQKI